MDYEFVRGQFTEAQLEAAIIELFQQQGYIYVHGEKIHRQYEDILLEDDLRLFLQQRYAHEGLSETETQKIINQLTLIPASPLYEGNRAAFWLVNEGFDLQRDDLSKVALHIDYIDFDHPENNIFKVVNQYSVQGERLRRPDMLVFINGIPIAIFEFKSAINEDANVHDAWEQITIRYTRDIPKLMKYCFLSVISDGANTKMGSTGIENVVDEHKSVDLFSDEFIEQLNTVKLPITKFNALLKLLRKAISAYGRTNKVKAIEFDERLRKVVDDYNSRDKLVFTSEVVSDFVNDLSDQLLQILKDLQEDQSSFEKMGISFEEKAFYDILVKVRDDHGFPYADEKCVILAKKIKELVDDKAQFADWATRDDIKNQLNMELTVLLYKNGYPPEWDEEVFEKVMEQAENFKRYSDKG